MTEADIEIDRIVLSLRLMGEPERLEPLARRLCGIAKERLPRVFDHIDLGIGQEEYHFIERLPVECSANSLWDDAAIAEHIARRLVLSLADSVAKGATLHFRDRAEFLAAFLIALADDTAFSRWWFDEFDGLRPLSISTALRTVLINEAEVGVSALSRLTQSMLDRVLGCLTTGDAARLLFWFEERSTPARYDLMGLWRLSAKLSADSAPIDWIAALIAAESSPATRIADGGPQGRSIINPSLAALRAMVRLRAIAHADSSVPADADNPLALIANLANLEALDIDWIDALAPGDVFLMARELEGILHGRAGRVKDSNGDGEPDVGRQDGANAETIAIIPHAGELPSKASPGHNAAEEISFSTPFGGAFLLLARFAKLGWIDLWQRVAADAPEAADRDELARSLSLIVVASALNPSAVARVSADPALRFAWSVAESMETVRRHRHQALALLRALAVPKRTTGHAEANRFGRSLDGQIDAAAAHLLETLAANLPGLAGSSPDYLRRNVLALPATVRTQTGGCLVQLGRAPLDVLLILTGTKRGRYTLPGGFFIELREDFSQ